MIDFPIRNWNQKAPGADLLFGKAICGWYLQDKVRALGASTPTVAGVGILSTQRFRRGRGRDFIYTKNVAWKRFGFYLRNDFRAAGGPMLISTNVLWDLVLMTIYGAK